MRVFLLMLWFAPFWVVYRCVDVAFESRVVPYPLGAMAGEEAPLFLRVFCPGSIWTLIALAVTRCLTP